MDGPPPPATLATALFAVALTCALAGCATAPRSASPRGSGDSLGRAAARLDAANPEDADGFTEGAYRALIAELGAATERLADQHSDLDPEVRADLLLHMAVAYQGLAQYERVLDQQRYDRSMRDCHDRGHDDCHDRVEPDFSRSEELEETARTCVTLLKRIRAHERAEDLRDKLEER